MADSAHNILDWVERPEELRAAVEFTAAETGFVPALIEKDYWCSVVLWRLFALGDCPLAFKGGTLLSKAYVTFNRLSEDLDFTLPTAKDVTRGERSRRGKAIASQVAAIAGEFGMEAGEWQSFNNSTQHQSVLTYRSVFGGKGTIKLEVGQREETMRPVVTISLSTLLLDPLFNETAVEPVEVSALAAIEAYAEKLRATLTRRDPAPRDLYDLHHAVTSGVLIWQDVEFLKLAALKLEDETNTGWLSEARIEAFRRSIEPELRPVLRPDAYDAFDFDAALASMVAVAEALKPHLPTT
jgi:predicted nucleotidyltransferase component of viral defense system